MTTPLELSQAYWEAECRRDVSGVLDKYAADATYRDSSGVYRGHTEIRRFYDASAQAFPGLEVTVVREFRLDQSSAIEFEARLTDPEGRRFLVRGINVVEVADGRFVSVRSYEDQPSPL